jgi:amino acid adenylation domain-containing protein
VSDPPQYVHELLAAVAERMPDAVAVIDGAAQISYRELDRRANCLAHHLLDAGAQPGSLIGVCLERSLDTVVAFLGVLKAGAAYVPIDPHAPAKRIAFMLTDAEARLVLTQRRWHARLPPWDGRVVFLDEEASRIGDWPASAPATGTSPGDLASVMYTSGSTGRPNGSLILHRAIVRLVCATNYITIQPRDRVAHGSNVCFDPATLEIWGALLNGACVVVIPQEWVLAPRELAARLRELGIAVLWLASAVFNRVAAAVPDAFASLRDLLIGGEALDARWVRRVLAAGAPRRLVNGYGPTECTVFATWYLIRELPEGARTVPIGRPIAGTDIHVLDDQLQPVAPGETGELYIGGEGLARGYLNRPELTRERFIPHPFSAEPGARLFRTQDLGRRRSDGELEFLGRRDRLVKVRGFRVEPGEIEATLNAHPAVQQSVVVAREDLAGERALVAYVVPEQASDVEDRASERFVGHWRRLYDDVIYREIRDGGPARHDPTFNLTGWISSYTGRPLHADEMREQVEQAVERILALCPPGAGPRRVLEIGCGTGLLLFRVAPRCDHYLATDFSTVALDHLGHQLAAHEPALSHVRLLHRAADDFTGIEPASFDVVVLNSVVQHFPDADYLQRVVTRAIGAVRPGGAVFVGDLRSLPLLEAFHASVQLYRAPAAWPTERLRRAVRARIQQEQELVVDPRLFEALAQRIPAIRAVTIRLRRGRHDNELTRFRYDVELRSGDPTSPPEPRAEVAWHDWERGPSLGELEALLRHRRPEPLGVRGLPNTRLLEVIEAIRLMADGSPAATIGELRVEAARRAAGRGVDPEELWQLGERLSLAVQICGSEGNPGSYDVVFHEPALSVGPARPPREMAHADLREYVNEPHLAVSTHELVPRLRRELARTLPEYLVPSAFVILDQLPLTPNGKIDQRALPEPAGAFELDRRPLAVSDDLEVTLANVWARVLGVERFGPSDNFFEIGGNSIKAAQVADELRQVLGIDVPIMRLFEHPTLRALAAALSTSAEPSLQAERSRGEARRRRRLAGPSDDGSTS